MNNPHQGARLTVYSRELIVMRHGEGRPVRQLAEEFGVSARTVHKWPRRFHEGGRAALVHVAVDDATRLAYVEVLPDEKKESATAFLARALAWFATQGIRVERVMTDNGSCYRSGLFASLLRDRSIRHIRTRPYTPKTNGKAERFILTLIREWAYGATYASPLHATGTFRDGLTGSTEPDHTQRSKANLRAWL